MNSADFLDRLPVPAASSYVELMKQPAVQLEELIAHDAWLRGLARRLIDDVSAVEDVVQQTYLTACEQRPADPSRTRAWLRRVVVNVIRMRARSDRRRRGRERAVARAEAIPSVSELVGREEARRRVSASVLALPELYRSVILYRYFEGLAPRTIARELGIGREAVETRLKRAVRLLRTRLEAEFGDGESLNAALAASWPAVASTGPAAVTSTMTGATIMVTKVKATIAIVLVGATAFALWPGSDEAPQERSRRALESSAEEHTRPPSGSRPTANRSASVAVLARAETAPSIEPSVAITPRRATIVGLVLDSAGKPLAGAKVRALAFMPGQLRAPELRATRTNDAGEYALERIEERCVVEASADDHYTERLVAIPCSRADFTLGKPGTVSGRLIGASERSACVGAAIALYPWRPSQRLERVANLQFAWTRPPAAIATSGVDGRFEVTSVRPGRYRVRVVPRGLPEVVRPDQIVDVRMASVSRIDVFIPRGLEVAGRVTDEETGAPVVGAQVTTLRRAGEPTTTNADGRYRLAGIHPSPAIPEDIRVVARGFAPYQRRLMKRETGLHDVRLKRALVIRGRVLGPDGEPLAGARVGPNSRGVGPWELPGQAYYPPSRTDEDGRFVCVISRRSGVLRMHAVMDGVGWGSSEPIRVPGDKPDDVVVRLPRGGSIVGRVRSAEREPLVGCRVSLFEGRTLRAVTHTTAQGAYAFPGVTAGEYALYVLPPGTLLEYDSPLAGQARTGIRVNVGTKTAVDVDLEYGATISGDVLDVDGRPLEGVVVRASPGSTAELLVNFSGRPPRMRHAVTNARGEFEVRGVQSELRYWLVAIGEGFEQTTIRAVEPGRRDVRLTLRQTRTVQGRVLDGETGRPIPEFRIRGVSIARDDGATRSIRFADNAGVFGDLDGRFRFPLSPGRYRIVAETHDGRSSDPYSLVVAESHDPDPVDLCAWPGASIAGNVRARGAGIKRFGAASVYDLREHPAQWLRTVNISEHGQLAIRPLQAGSYLVVGRATREDGVRVEGAAVVEVAARSVHRIDLVLDELSPVDVRVLDRRDRPVDRARVTLHRPDGAGFVMSGSQTALYDRTWRAWREDKAAQKRESLDAVIARAMRGLSVTGVDGRLARLMLIPGEYRVECAAEGHATRRRTIRVRPGANDVTIRVE